MVARVDSIWMGSQHWQRALYQAMQGQPVRTVWGQLAMLPLWLASQVYHGLACGQRLSYQYGIRTKRSLPCPVISIGNLTVGGTGKTPLTMWVARWYQQQGCRVAVLSRGYGAQTAALQVVSTGHGPVVPWHLVGDEPYLLAQSLPGVAVLTSPHRYRSGLYAYEHLHTQVVILDDGFQHHALHRDLDIVLIDASNPFGHGTLLPRGLLREPITALQRAHAIVLTRVEQAQDTLASLSQLIRQKYPHTPVYGMRTCVSQAYDKDTGVVLAPQQLQQHRIVAFAGLGNPQAFTTTMAQLTGTVVACLTFPDHHPYTIQDCQAIATIARQRQASCLLTTEKDAVRLPTAWSSPLPLYVLPMHIAFRPDAPALSRQLEAYVPGT